MAFIRNASKDEIDDRVNAQLAQLEDRLVTQYTNNGHHTEPEIRAHFQRATQHFADARVRIFLPILIERTLRKELMHLTDKASVDDHR